MTQSPKIKILLFVGAVLLLIAVAIKISQNSLKSKDYLTTQQIENSINIQSQLGQLPVKDNPATQQQTPSVDEASKYPELAKLANISNVDEDSTNEPIAFLEKHKIQILFAETCKKDEDSSEEFFCISCDSDICKNANEIYQIGPDKNIKLIGDLKNPQKAYYMDTEHADQLLLSYSPEIDAKAVTNSSLIAVGQNNKTFIDKIHFFDLESLNEPKQWISKCKTYPIIQQDKWDVKKDKLTKMIYYTKVFFYDGKPEISVSSTGFFDGNNCLDLFRRNNAKDGDLFNGIHIDFTGSLQIDNQPYVLFTKSDAFAQSYFYGLARIKEKKLILLTKYFSKTTEY